MKIGNITLFDDNKCCVLATKDGNKWVLPILDGHNLFNLPGVFNLVEDSDEIETSGLYFVTSTGQLIYHDGSSWSLISTMPSIDDTSTVSLSNTDNVLKGSVKISNSAGNIISANNDGLFASVNTSSFVTSNTMSSYVRFTDYAQSQKAGTVSVDGSSGISVNPDNGKISVKTGNGIAINANGEIIATGTGDIDYNTLREQLGINTLANNVASKIDSSATSAIISDITKNNSSIVITKLNNSSSSISLPVLSSGSYITSSQQIEIYDTEGNTATVDISEVIAAAAHTHSNKSSLDKIGEDSSGKFTYNGNAIGGMQQFSNEITRNDETGVITWLNDVAEIIHNLGTLNIINVSLIQNMTNGNVIMYNNYGYYATSNNTIRIAVPSTLNLSNGTWTVIISAMA